MSYTIKQIVQITNRQIVRITNIDSRNNELQKDITNDKETPQKQTDMQHG